MIPNAITNSATTQSPSSTVQFHNKEEREDNLSLIIGIASLILEGRPIGDEYQIMSGSLNKEDENRHLTKVEYNNIFSEPNSVFPSTSKILKNVSRSNAVNTTAQKLYQLRQKAMVTRIDTSIGKKVTSTISNSAEYSTHNTSIDFNPEDEDINTVTNVHDDESGCLYSLQSLATTCLQSGTISARPCKIVYGAAAQGLTKANEENPDFPTDCVWTPTATIDMKKIFIGSKCDNKLHPLNLNQGIPNSLSSNSSIEKKKQSFQRMQSPTQLQQGPHCDQFLKKIGLSKAETFEADEHYCDMSYLNITCSRWKAYCLKIEAIIKRGLPVCIEVYLGPVSHKILLEQWIVKINERAITPTMTLPSLCSAIRSQLYFSQISAWCDLIKKCEKSVEETGRVVFCMTNNSAGDLIQTPQPNLSTTFGSSSTNSIPKIAAPIKRRPRLNIFYRIRHFDSTACFNSKPRIHNFPNVNVSENFSISVCLKSLPRLSGGIPKVGQFLTNSNENTSPQIFPDKKDNYCANSSSFKNSSFEKMNVPKEYTIKICDTNISKPTSTTDCFISLMSDDFSSLHQNSNADNKKFFSTKQSDFELKSESECSNSLDGLSHREKQLLKYRKRMLKRDKQLRSCFKNTSICYPQYTKPLNNFLSNNQKNWTQIDRDVSDNNIKHNSTSVTKTSIGTQTQQTCCKQCGNVKSFVCLTCHKSLNDSCINQDDFSSINNYSNNIVITQTPCNKADLLLQAIQRTPQTARLKKKCSSVDQALASIIIKPPQNNNYNLMTTGSSNSKIGCRVCKRQKTQHIYNDQRKNEEDKMQDQDFVRNTCEKEDFEQYINSNIFTNETTPSTAINQRSNTTLESEFQRADFKTPTEEDQNGKSADKAIKTLSEFFSNLREIPNEQISKNVSMAQQKNTIEIQTVTPTAVSNNSKTLRKCLPKINLTPIFCKSQNAMGEQYWSSITNPVSVDLKESSSLNKTFFSRIDNFVTIQKSNSAPTLPNSLELSPRFTKQTNSSKTRSRHFSDRSDRSSFCSDEPFSDEEFENSICSPTDSPNKNKKSYLINIRRQPLLGNLEESLLQKRLVPKMEVVGFKVLLGASGGFCPTQLTIPASTYFYELHGVDISTPYICEIQLPRKGYVVPRSGTVQVTLLNPTGTVVRMFVVPYDMRDMPPLHCTFVRQRILAEENTDNLKSLLNDTSRKNKNSFDYSNKSMNDNSKKNNESSEKQFGHFISPEHMKRLRYCIHLKFQTSRSGRLLLHTDIRLLISRRTDCDTAIAHAKGALESSNDLVIHTFMPGNPTYSTRQENLTKL